MARHEANLRSFESNTWRASGSPFETCREELTVEGQGWAKQG